MGYIEVARLQAQAGKIQDQLDVVLSDKPHLYSKTKQRYQDLAVSLLSSVEKIATILEADILEQVDNTSSEFGRPKEYDSVDLAEALQHTSERIQSYTQFVSTNIQNVTNNVNKETLRRYGQILEQASNYNFRYSEANECAYILYKWFKTRFSSSDSSFRYNIAYIPNWITDIIILYGKYHSKNDTQGFVSMMSNWCSDLEKDGSKWAVPYEVHQLRKQSDPSNFTMDAVLVGDILMDDVLYLLTESHSPDVVANLGTYPVASQVKICNPSLLPIIRTRIAKRDKLVEEYNFTVSERRQ